MATAKLRRGSGEANLFGSCMRFPGRDGIEDGKALNGIRDLVKVFGGYALPGFSGVALEKEVNGRRGNLGLRVRVRIERIHHSVQKELCRGYYCFLLFILGPFLMRFDSIFSTDSPCLIYVQINTCSYYL